MNKLKFQPYYSADDVGIPGTVPPVVEDWTFGDPTPTPSYVTREDLDASLSRLVNDLKPQETPDFEEQLIQKTMQRIQPQLEAAQEARFAPLLRKSVVEGLTKGLSTEAQAYLDDELSRYSTAQLSSITQDKRTLDLLRRAAVDVHREKSSPNAQVPGSIGTTIRTDNLDPDLEKVIDFQWEMFKHVPGMTKEKLREEVLKEVG